MKFFFNQHCLTCCLTIGIIGCSTTGQQTSVELELPVLEQEFDSQPPVSPTTKLTESVVSLTEKSEQQSANPTEEEQAPLQLMNFEQSASETASAEISEMGGEETLELKEVPWGRSGMSIHDFEHLAFQNNPAIRQASAAAAQVNGIRTQVGLAPNPTVGYFGEEIGNDGAAGLHGAFISQTFVRGGKLAWNQDVIGHDLNSVRWLVETERQRVRTDVRMQFYKALAAQQRLDLARDFREVAEQGLQISKDRVSALVGTRPDVLQSQIQVSEVELSIRQAELDFSAAWNELAATVGMPGLVQTSLQGELLGTSVERDLETSYAQIVAGSPRLASAHAQVDRARANLQRQKVQAIPNVTAQVGLGRDDGTGDGFANVQLSLPLPLRNKNQGNIQAAQAAYCAAVRNVERLKMEIRQDLAGVLRDYQVAKATVEQYEVSILPNAQETLELMQEAQQAGEFDFLRVLTARRAYFDANSKYITAMADLAQADAKIDGLLLMNSLSNGVTYGVGDDLRGQALSGQ